MSWAAEQTAAFLDLASVFGVTAVWHPSSGASAVIDEPVLFDSASKGLGLDAPGHGIDTRFEYTDYVMTALAERFPGLKGAVESGAAEVIEVFESGAALGRYYARSAKYIGDGALLEMRLSDIRGGAHADANRGQPDPTIARILAGVG